MATHFKSTILLLAATFVLQAATHATERTDILYTQPIGGTLVRDIGNNRSIICDKTGGNSNTPSFTMFIPGSSTLSLIIIDVDTIFDFEVFNDNVFFCGVKNNATGGYGVLGYFPLAGFPSTTVNYLKVSLFRRVRKLEVGYMMGHTHIIAIGDGIHGRAELVDAVDLGTTWNMNFFDASDDAPMFIDLAITDNYVVVAAIVNEGITCRARIYYFDKPTTPLGTLGPTNVPWRDIYDEASADIIIESCTGNAFVVAIASGVNVIFNTRFIIVAYDAFNHISTNHLVENTPLAKLEDIEYEKSTKVLELMLYINDGDTKYSVIYTLIPAMATSNLNAAGHLFYDICLSSLDKCSAQSNHFIAIGNYKLGANYMVHVLYDFNQWDRCSEYTENMIVKRDPFVDIGELAFGHVDYTQNPTTYIPSDKTVNTFISCK